MPVIPTYPGVYVQEVPSGVRTITGVSTSVAMFIGRTKQGLLDQPILCTNYSDFERAFSADTSLSEMTHYVKLFFINGGTQCYVMRIAHGATAASVTLQSEAGTDVLVLTAKQPGLVGETIRAAVTYNGLLPEITFNLELFRWVTDATGRQVQADRELWQNLSMNPQSPLYAPLFITQNSTLVNANLAAGAAPTANGFSQSGRLVEFDNSDPTDASAFLTTWETLIGDEPTATANQFQLKVDDSSFVSVNLSNIDVSAVGGGTIAAARTALATAIQAAIALPPGYAVIVEFVDGPTMGTNESVFLRITSDNATGTGEVYIRPAGGAQDAAVPLRLGAAQGGLEVSAYSELRPAPTGLTLPIADPTVLTTVTEALQQNLTQFQLEQVQPDGSLALVDLPVATINASTGGLREKLGLIRDAINAFQRANPRTFFWRAELWGDRLAIVPLSGTDNAIGNITLATAATDIAALFTANVRYYSVGIRGTAGNQVPAATEAFDGDPPTASDYDNAYQIVDARVDLFNLMVLPPDATPAQSMADLWGAASVFCQQRRAFLLMDAPADWTTVQTAIDNVDDLRIGLVKDYSALFYPQITINDNGLRRNIGASGAIAGLMARIDGTRGVWKAAAGIEADLRGIEGLRQRFSDAENGVLNPRAINTIRVFPNGIVNWGARTMDGDNDFASEWKYIPIRRLALFIEESLYRGLKWVVFEPNDEPLWAQIRLNVGAFMQTLFRQGAFQGKTAKEAYFVKCDAETTTQTDRNLGMVNIWVGFAPLKPAEFVILYLQQMAGQIEV